MNAVHNTLNRCVKCLKCMKGCPIDAIHFIDGKAVIQAETCIDCGRCMDVCTHNGIFSLTSSLDATKSYRYNIVLVPSAYYSQFPSVEEISKSFRALQMLGFDEVIDLTPFGASVMDATVKHVEDNVFSTSISSHCPVITRLIKRRYPTLLSSIVPINYASEVAAKQERKRIMEEQNLAKEDIGIFLLCECAGKIGLAKYPLNNLKYEVDHAISISSIAALLRRTMSSLQPGPYSQPLAFSKHGLLYAVKDGIRRILKDYSVINIDGIEKAIDVLELAEFDRLEGIRFITMSSCYNGCVGGNFLWTNPFTGRIQIEKFIQQSEVWDSGLQEEALAREVVNTQNSDERTMKEKLAWYEKIEKIYEKLPGIDCGACGFPSCRHMAEEIALGHRNLSNCRIK